MVIEGKLGIGTASPIATLNVKGSTSLDGGVTIRDSQDNLFWQSGTSHPATLSGGLFGTNSMRIRSGADITLLPTAPADNVVIEGKLGIGTASPIATLNVKGSTSLDGAVTIRDTQDNVFWQFGTTHPATLTGGLFGANSMRIRGGGPPGGPDAPVILQPNGGEVRIGTATNSSPFSVHGETTLHGDVVVRGRGRQFFLAIRDHSSSHSIRGAIRHECYADSIEFWNLPSTKPKRRHCGRR